MWSTSRSEWTRPFSFVDNGVNVWNIPMLKLKPGGKFRGSVIGRQVRNICALLSNNHFAPDVITGHWVNPQLMLVSMLGERLNCKTAFVFHSDYGQNVIRKFDIARRIQHIDRIGCRSEYASKALKRLLMLPEQPFVCYSGVPDCYIQNAAANEGLQYLNILCAARLVGYKNVGSTIAALSQLEYDCKLSIVGEGPLKGDLEKQVKSLGLEGQVSFLGTISRELLQEEMHRSTMFVLISDHEVFGLVYIEAMLQGCVVVASRESGADGIIVDGVNGFLCEAGNCYELAEIIRRVARMGSEERKRLSLEAQKTAKRFADSKVAEMYLNNIS